MAGNAGDGSASGASSLFRLIALLFAGFGLLAVAVVIIRGQDWSAAEHRSNYRELDIVGRSIESWPVSVEAMARSNLLPDRLEAPPDALVQYRDGWAAAARFDHPEIGELLIYYKLMPQNPIADRKLKCANGATKDASIENSKLRMQGTIRMDELWQSDQAFNSSASNTNRLDAVNYEQYFNVLIPQNRRRSFSSVAEASVPAATFQPADCPAFQYRADIPLQKIANLAANAPAFETVLMLNTGGKVIASLGGAAFPVVNIGDIVPEASAYRDTLRQLLAATAKDGKQLQAEAEARARKDALTAQRSARPLSVVVAGQNYIAYFRPVEIGGGWQTSACKPDVVVSEAAGNGDVLKAPETNCLLIGLVPERDVEARLFSLAPDVLTILLVLLALLIVLVPVTKLRALGPAGDLKSIEAWAAIFGLVAAFALATLALLLILAGIRSHARADQALDRTSQAIEGDFNRELLAMVGRPIMVPKVRMNGDVPMASPTIYGQLGCIFADGSSTGSNTAQKSAIGPQFWLVPKAPGAASENFNWPMRENVALFGEMGKAFPGYAMLANRCHSGGRADISARSYFQDAIAERSRHRFPAGACNMMPGLTLADHYTIGAVRSQSDGSAKVIVAAHIKVNNKTAKASGGLQSCTKDVPAPTTALVPASPEARLQQAATTTASTAAGPQHGVMILVMTMRSLLAPVLSPGHGFIVVDASDRQLPYLFGSSAHRIGIVTLADAFDATRAGEAIARAYRDTAHDSESDTKPSDAARAATAKPPRPHHFTALFEGVQQDFTARGIRGTPWVLLVHRPVDTVDMPLAASAGFAAGAWFGLALLASLGVAAAYVWRGRRLWLWLWPQPGLGDAAAAAGNRLLIIVTVTLVLVFASAMEPSWLMMPAAILGVPALALWIGKRSVVEAQAGLHSQKGPIALMPRDERGFARLFLGLLLALGALPMTALWFDARSDQRVGDAAMQIVQLENAWQANREALTQQVESLGLDDQTLSKDNEPKPGKTGPAITAPVNLPYGQKWTGVPGLDPHATVENATAPVHTTRKLREWAGLGRDEVLAGCSKITNVAAEFCVDADGRVGLLHPFDETSTGDYWTWVGAIWWPGLVGGLLGLIGLLAILRDSFAGLLRGLFGFGTPLEAVNHPAIMRVKSNPVLPDRSVVLNGPLALAIDLLKDADPYDLGAGGMGDKETNDDAGEQADSLLARQVARLQAGQTVVVVGLDVAMKEKALRRIALLALERLSSTIDHLVRGNARHGRLVVMTDLAPLDRILQAFEREQDENRAPANQSRQPISRPEQLRWSRLFEDFTTYTLPVTAKFSWSAADEAAAHEIMKEQEIETDPDRREGTMQLMREMRYLPEAVLNSVIAPDDIPGRAKWTELAGDRYPLSEAKYHSVYRAPLWRWALTVRPATKAAAIDYLRGTLIEHYQHVWAASSHAERVILDNLARGRLVNLQAALAMRSLIRRGLVVLDPMPRLLNQSFAAFVRQAEKPDAIERWRGEQPKGIWDRISGPLTFLVPTAVLVLAGVALLAGESPATILPIVLGAGPALLSTLSGARRTS